MNNCKPIFPPPCFGFGSHWWLAPGFINLFAFAKWCCPNSLIPSLRVSWITWFFFKSPIFYLVCSGTICSGKAELMFSSFLLFTHFQNKLIHGNPPMWSVCYGFSGDIMNSWMFMYMYVQVDVSESIAVTTPFFKVSYFGQGGISSSLASKSLRQDCSVLG